MPGGLYLEVAATGSKRWFVKYRFGGKEKRLALGNYPLVSLKEAREGRDKAKKARGEGGDPVQARRVAKVINRAASAQTFEAVAREFFKTKKGGWSPKYAARWIERMEKDLFNPITGEVDPPPEPRKQLAKRAASALVLAGLDAIKARRGKSARRG